MAVIYQMQVTRVNAIGVGVVALTRAVGAQPFVGARRRLCAAPPLAGAAGGAHAPPFAAAGRTPVADTTPRQQIPHP